MDSPFFLAKKTCCIMRGVTKMSRPGTLKCPGFVFFQPKRRPIYDDGSTKESWKKGGKFC